MSPPAKIMTFRLTLAHMTFDVDPYDLWPWPIWPLTRNITCKTVKRDLKSCFLPSDLDFWPMTLTFSVDLGFIQGHALIRFSDRRSNSFRDMD